MNFRRASWDCRPFRIRKVTVVGDIKIAADRWKTGDRDGAEKLQLRLRNMFYDGAEIKFLWLIMWECLEKTLTVKPSTDFSGEVVRLTVLRA